MALPARYHHFTSAASVGSAVIMDALDTLQGFREHFLRGATDQPVAFFDYRWARFATYRGSRARITEEMRRARLVFAQSGPPNRMRRGGRFFSGV